MDEDDSYKRTIYVGNLPLNVTNNDLYAFFNTFGEIVSIQIPKDHVKEQIRGFAFIEFDQRQDASSAIDNYDKTQFMERTIKVRRSRPLDSKPDYNGPVWKKDQWLQKIQQKKIDDQQYTLKQQQKNRAQGLPIFKNVEKPEDQKPIVYIEEDN